MSIPEEEQPVKDTYFYERLRQKREELLNDGLLNEMSVDIGIEAVLQTLDSMKGITLVCVKEGEDDASFLSPDKGGTFAQEFFEHINT